MTSNLNPQRPFDVTWERRRQAEDTKHGKKGIEQDGETENVAHTGDLIVLFNLRIFAEHVDFVLAECQVIFVLCNTEALESKRMN